MEPKITLLLVWHDGTSSRINGYPDRLTASKLWSDTNCTIILIWTDAAWSSCWLWWSSARFKGNIFIMKPTPASSSPLILLPFFHSSFILPFLLKNILFIFTSSLMFKHQTCPSFRSAALVVTWSQFIFSLHGFSALRVAQRWLKKWRKRGDMRGDSVYGIRHPSPPVDPCELQKLLIFMSLGINRETKHSVNLIETQINPIIHLKTESAIGL